MLFEAAATAPAPKTDADSMWTGLLALIRALILGRRLPPDQLRSFLLFAPPVDYLSAKKVAALLADNGGDLMLNEEDAIPEGWTLGPEVNECDCCEMHDYEARVFGETIRNLLRTEHPEWEHEWKTAFDDSGHETLAYRVLDERGRVHPIACWMEGKLQLIADGAIDDKAAERTVAIDFIERMLEYLLDCLGDGSREYLELEQDVHEAAIRLTMIKWWDEKRGANPDLYVAATRIYDTGQFNIDNYDGPYAFVLGFDKVATELGWYEEYTAKRRKQKKLFAAQ